jgi:hypothetical protein
MVISGKSREVVNPFSNSNVGNHDNVTMAKVILAAEIKKQSSQCPVQQFCLFCSLTNGGTHNLRGYCGDGNFRGWVYWTKLDRYKECP